MQRAHTTRQWSSTTQNPVRVFSALVTAGYLCLQTPSVLAQTSPAPTPLAEMLSGPQDCGMPSDAIIAASRQSQGIPIAPDRFVTDILVWTGDGAQGLDGQAAPARLTYSFPDDGVTWGLSEIFNQQGPNTLNATIRDIFGAGNLDVGREYIRQALAAWAHDSGLTYDEVVDDNTLQDTSTLRTPSRGDIRIGGVRFFLAPFAAYNAFPSNGGLSGVGGGDMVLNNSAWSTGRLIDPTNDFSQFRSLVGHEHGHGLGFIHVVPCNATKLMEPFIDPNHNGPSIDDLRAAAASYGDRFAGNHVRSTAHDFGNLTTPQIHSLRIENLSTNGAAGPGGTSDDWFQFTIDSAQDVSISAIPTGGVYQASEQITGCFPDPAPLVDAQGAARLSVEVFPVSSFGSLGATQAPQNGTPASIVIPGLTSGTYVIHVRDDGPDGAESVQLYTLDIRLGSIPSAPDAFAGINKRVAVRTRCAFMGHINSRATEPGATLTPQSFDWDLDGDGVFETLDTPAPVHVYDIPGVFPVTLRVTDSNGLSATHTIQVNVFQPLTTIDQVTPDIGPQGDAVPVMLSGAHLENVITESQVSVSGTGITILGTPQSDPSGTSLSGLTFVVDSAAALGPRDVVVSTPTGANSAAGVFTVAPARPVPFALLSPAAQTLVPSGDIVLQWEPSSGADSYLAQLEVDLNDDGTSDQIVFTTSNLTQTQLVVSGTQLRPKTTYSWSIAAVNGSGARLSSPSVASFRTPDCPGDATYDKQVDFADLQAVLGSWNAVYISGRSGPGDSDNNGIVNFSDITFSLSQWRNTCP